MGCSSSTELDPNLMYGVGHKNIPQSNITQTETYNNERKILPLLFTGKENSTNGHVTMVTTDSGLEDSSSRNQKQEERKTMKGDLSMYNDAKVQRERKLRQRLMKRERLAQEMSDKAMEENERLSLTSSWSRATSRATSPRGGRTKDLRWATSAGTSQATNENPSSASSDQTVTSPESPTISTPEDENKNKLNGRTVPSTLSPEVKEEKGID